MKYTLTLPRLVSRFPPRLNLSTSSTISQFHRPNPTKMEYTRLGDSGLKISKVILGAMSYGTPDWQEWVLDEEKSLPLIEHAYKVGLNTWDTVCMLPPKAHPHRPLASLLTKPLLPHLGRRILKRSLRRNHRKSHPEISNPPRETSHPFKMLFRSRQHRRPATDRANERQ